MADYITPQDLQNAHTDAKTLEQAVNGAPDTIVTARLGASYPALSTVKRIVDTLQTEKTTAINNLNAAINTAAAAGAGANGWTDLLITTSDGRTQQQINNVLATERVNILDFYTDDYGTAMTQAIAKAMQTRCRLVYVPSGLYAAKTTASATLQDNFNIEYANGVVVNVINKINVHDFVLNDKRLNIVGNGAYFYAKWTDTDATKKPALFKIKSNTLSKSLTMDNVNTEWGVQPQDNGFYYGIYGFGLNYSKIENCLFQAQYPIWNETNTDGGNSMGSNINDCFLHAVKSSVTLVNNGVLGCEGWTCKGGEYFAGVDGAVKIIDKITANGYLSPLFRAIGVHMNAPKFFDLSGVGRVVISACDLQAQITKDLSYNGLFELEGVQVLSICGGTTISQASAGGTEPVDSKPIIYVRNSAKNKKSAYFRVYNIQPWLYQNAPFIKFENTGCYIGTVAIGNFNDGIFTGKYCESGFEKKIDLSNDLKLDNISNSSAISVGNGTFNNGVLTLDKPPAIGNFYNIDADVVPNGAVINQISCPSAVGKKISIRFEAAMITLNHNAQLNMPSDNAAVLTTGGVIECFAYNSALTRVCTLPAGSILKTGVPKTTGDYGIPGQKVFSGGTVYEYVSGTGWIKYAAATF